MDINEIRTICINSSQVLYQYLVDNNSGEQLISVRAITKKNKEVYKLSISKKLFNQDAVFFHLLDENERLGTEIIKIVQYDRDKNTLIIKVPEELQQRFSKFNNNDIRLISDLKFLVQQVEKWYENNGSEVHLPTKKSILSNAINDITYFKDANPSINQKKAIAGILTNPFTYIWGAPGTGKTQFVLAYALLQYLKAGKRVAIFAPTNNAIEQVLRGVITMTDKAGYNRDKIIRLGSPTAQFADDFPEVCEARGLQKRIEETEKQLEILQSVLSSRTTPPNIISLREATKEFENFKKLKTIEIPKIDTRINILKKDVQILTDNYQHKLKEEEELKLSLTKAIEKVDSFLYKCYKFFKSDKATEHENTVKIITDKLNKKGLEVKEAKSEADEGKKQLNHNEIILGNHKQQLKDYVDKIKDLCKKDRKANEVAAVLMSSNLLERFEGVRKVLKEAENEFEILNAVTEEYNDWSVDKIKRNTEKLLASITKLKALTTKERLKNVGVVAATLDTYIGRFMEEKLDVEHIFLDEAGYSNIIKALTLFNHDVPITFLGDHLQLPPVCEVNDSKIQREEAFRNVFVWSQSAIYMEDVFQKSKDILLKEYINNTLFKASVTEKYDLIQTFRFGQKLASALDKGVYNNGFHSGNSENTTEIYFVNAPRLNSFDRRESDGEVKAIIEIVKNLGHNDFIILSPYTKQRNAICNYNKELQKNDKVLTVHGSQGREWNTVILSVADKASDAWFTDSTNSKSKGLNLINTAVSRAKKELIIVCDYNQWSRKPNQLIKQLLDIATKY
jgi:ferritin-like metal-binding protein YciE